MKERKKFFVLFVLFVHILFVSQQVFCINEVGKLNEDFQQKIEKLEEESNEEILILEEKILSNNNKQKINFNNTTNEINKEKNNQYEIDECIIGDRVEYHENLIANALHICRKLNAKKTTIIKSNRYNIQYWISHMSSEFKNYSSKVKWINPNLKLNNPYTVWDYLYEISINSSLNSPHLNRILIYPTFPNLHQGEKNEFSSNFQLNFENINIPTILYIHNPPSIISIPSPLINRSNVLILLTSPHAYNFSIAYWKWKNDWKGKIDWALPLFTEDLPDLVSKNIISATGSIQKSTRDFNSIFNLFQNLPIEKDYLLNIFSRYELTLFDQFPNLKYQLNLGETEITPWKFDKYFKFITSSKFSIVFTPEETSRYKSNAISSTLIESVSLGVPLLCTNSSYNAFGKYFKDLVLPVKDSEDLLKYLELNDEGYQKIRENLIVARERYDNEGMTKIRNWLNELTVK